MATSTRKQESGKLGTLSKRVANSTSQQGSKTSEESEWLSMISTVKAEDTEVPPGWKTAREISLIWGVTDTRAQKKLLDLYLAGKIERKAFKVFLINRYYTIFYYCIKK